MKKDKTKSKTLCGAEILIKSLKENGINVIFGYPGGAVLDIFNHLHDSDLEFYLTRHEQGAVHAADGYARASGKCGVCIATSGPGATNLVTGIATAQMDSIPLIAITGQVPTALIGNEAFQEVARGLLALVARCIGVVANLDYGLLIEPELVELRNSDVAKWYNESFQSHLDELDDALEIARRLLLAHLEVLSLGLQPSQSTRRIV